MALIGVDEDGCTRCGLCVRVCPGDVLSQEAQERIPEARRPEHCILCGHCVAACPHGALVHKGMAMDAFLPVQDIAVGPDEIEAFLASKRSVRLFFDEPVEAEAIERLLKVADTAPSAHNARRRGFAVVLDEGTIRAMEAEVAAYYKRLLFWIGPVARTAMALVAPDFGRRLKQAASHLAAVVRKAEGGARPIFRGAPCIICIHAPRADPLSRDDCLAAQHYLMLQAHAMGLGTCIIGYATVAHKAVEKHLNMPKGHRVFAVTIVGYPIARYRKAISHGPPKVSRG